MSDPGWYGDPFGAPAQRWWDGATWTTATWPPIQVPVPTPAGWYDDDTHPGTVRWWDGATWTERFARVEVPRGPASEIGRGRATTIAVVALAAALALGVVLVVVP